MIRKLRKCITTWHWLLFCYLLAWLRNPVFGFNILKVVVLNHLLKARPFSINRLSFMNLTQLTNRYFDYSAIFIDNRFSSNFRPRDGREPQMNSSDPQRPPVSTLQLALRKFPYF